jgi:hypothetical protein
MPAHYLAPTGPPLRVGLVAAAAATTALVPQVPRSLRVLLLSTSPRLLIVDDFMPALLCDALRTLAADKLVRSRVASGAAGTQRVT